MSEQWIRRYVRAFEDLRPASLDELVALFRDDARFVDPFNEVRGRAAIRRVFAHMFAQCEAPRFHVDETVGSEHTWYLHWTFDFGAPGRRRRITGVSRVRFDAAGLVCDHADFWDPAAQLYESIPLLGRVLRALRRRLGSDRGRDPSTRPGDTPFATER